MAEPFRVLVIDDDPGIRDYLEALGSKQGYRVSSVGDGEEALATGQRCGRPFDTGVGVEDREVESRAPTRVSDLGRAPQFVAPLAHHLQRG